MACWDIKVRRQRRIATSCSSAQQTCGLKGRLLHGLTTMFSRKSKKGEDFDEALFHVTRYKPEELQVLERTTKFTRKEIQLIYRGFKQECPTGLVDEHSFKEIISQFFPQGDATQYAQFVFKTLNHGHSGAVNFEQFLRNLSQVSRGTLQEKLRWVFRLYDLNGDGYITKSEMTTVAGAIFDMLGRNTEPPVNESTARQHVDKIFDKIDINQDGLITFDELSQWCTREERFLTSLNMLDTML